MKKKSAVKVVAAIQARMGSTRLPGKPLMDIAGSPMIEHIIKRLSASRSIDMVCVATTKNPKDNKLVNYLKSRGIPYLRGSELDIIGRLHEVVAKYNADTLVRVWGDCPLVDPFVIDDMLEKYLQEKADFATNSEPFTYPFGMNVEVYGRSTLEDMFNKAQDPFYKEFPVEYVKSNTRFKMVNLEYPKDASHISLTVDYPQDAELVSEVIKDLSEESEIPRVGEVIKYYEKNKKKFDKTSELERNIEYKKELETRGDAKAA